MYISYINLKPNQDGPLWGFLQIVVAKKGPSP